jgi:hypothetical protein
MKKFWSRVVEVFGELGVVVVLLIDVVVMLLTLLHSTHDREQ